MRVLAPLAILLGLIVAHQGKPGRPSWAAWAAALLILGACFRFWDWSPWAAAALILGALIFRPLSQLIVELLGIGD